MTAIAQTIRKQREILGLSQNTVAESLNLSIHEYSDIECHEDELGSNIPLSTVNALCRYLGLDVLDLMGIACVFCGGSPDDTNWRLPRHTICRKAREDAGLSVQDVATAIGYETDAIAENERREDALESWSVEAILQIGEILKIPAQLLIGVHCSRCGH